MPTVSKSSFVAAGAKRLGVSPTTIYKYCNGEQYPVLTTLRRIDEAFGWSVMDQIQLIPDAGIKDPSYGMVLAEVLREHFGAEGQEVTAPAARPKRGPYRSRGGSWTHATVADILNLRVNNVSRWLNGERYPEVRSMLRIEQRLGWPAAEQIVLVPIEGYDDRYAAAFRPVLDRYFQDH